MTTQNAESISPAKRRIGSLCSGYGGLDLGLMSVIGGSVAWHVEYDKHPSAVLDARWPGVPNYGDITTVDWSQVEPVDWLTAGYPCQPFSIAGRKQGAADERHLWPFVADAIGVLRPRRVFLENVAHHVAMGLDAVLWDLAALGYDATWGVVRAADAGAPHGRARVFVLATDTRGEAVGLGAGLREGGPRGVGGRRPDDHLAQTVPDPQGDGRDEGWAEPARLLGGPDASISSAIVTTDANGSGPQGPEPARRCELPTWGPFEHAVRRWESVTGRLAPEPTEPGPRRGRRLAVPFVEWLMGLPAGWVSGVGIPRNAQLKALGNGVVPHQAALALAALLPTAEAVAA